MKTKILTLLLLTLPIFAQEKPKPPVADPSPTVLIEYQKKYIIWLEKQVEIYNQRLSVLNQYYANEEALRTQAATKPEAPKPPAPEVKK